MSIAATQWTFAQHIPNAAAKLVLLALADHADDAGGSCFPGMGRLATMTSRDARVVRRALAELEAAGVISRKRSTGGHRRNTTRYQLNIPKGGQDVPRKGGQDVPRRGGKMSPEPSLEPSLKTTTPRSKPLRVIAARGQRPPGGGDSKATDYDRLLHEVALLEAKRDPTVKDAARVAHHRVSCPGGIRERVDAWRNGNTVAGAWLSPAVLAEPAGFAHAVMATASRVLDGQSASLTVATELDKLAAKYAPPADMAG